MTTNRTRRLLLLLAFLLLGLSAVFLLPASPKRPEPGVIMALPEYIGPWYGRDAAVTQKEYDALGTETRFARKLYTNGQGDSVYVSIVLGGQDMSTSIHRPERCLPAQGYTVTDSRPLKVELQTQPLTVTRLHNLRPLYADNGKPLVSRDGKSLNEFSLVYYWFVGSTDTTNNHNTRYYMDSRDRLLKGYNQPWAYVTVMSRIGEHLEPFGHTEAQTDAILQTFVQNLAPLIQKPSVRIR